jgi:selenocysteine-specific translation elongation factor
MGKPCRVTFEGKVFFKPDFIKRFLDTLHLEDSVVEESKYLKSIGYDNAFNEGDPMLIREKKAEAKAEEKTEVNEKDVESTAKALEEKLNPEFKNTIEDKLSKFDKQIENKKFPSALEVAEYVLPRSIFNKYKKLPIN